MSMGTLLVGIGVGLLVAAFVGRPFRHTSIDNNRIVEEWVAWTRTKTESLDEEAVQINPVEMSVALNSPAEIQMAEPVNFCPQCGRRVEVDHKFCPGCGTPLTGKSGKSL
ncbi:MAG: zinc-ribbon domain-containing protein [Anaerolineae bacterium]|nr:zinc-ribbon domain-containing protein [Anaerolineae bacterium]